MKKYRLPTLIILFSIGCDPVSVMDVDIKNSSTESITVYTVPSSSTIMADTLYIESNSTERLWEGMSTTGVFLEPSFDEYDSVYVKNELGEIIKVYKPNTQGKNIYDIDKYWESSEPSKRVYKYLYEINVEDLN